MPCAPRVARRLLRRARSASAAAAASSASLRASAVSWACASASRRACSASSRAAAVCLLALQTGFLGGALGFLGPDLRHQALLVEFAPGLFGLLARSGQLQAAVFLPAARPAGSRSPRPARSPRRCRRAARPGTAGGRASCRVRSPSAHRARPGRGRFRRPHRCRAWHRIRAGPGSATGVRGRHRGLAAWAGPETSRVAVRARAIRHRRIMAHRRSAGSPEPSTREISAFSCLSVSTDSRSLPSRALIAASSLLTEDSSARLAASV